MTATAAVQNPAPGPTIDPAEAARLAALALDEDLAGGVDITTLATVPSDQVATADVVARSDGVVAGLPIATAVFAARLGTTAGIELVAADGDRVRAGQVLLTVTGPTRELLTAERSALNLLTHLSGVSTFTARWVDAVAGTGALIRDTRKTMPGLRAAEKYAVRCGGGFNHRMGLHDQALIKDNHVVAAGGVVAALHAVRERFPDVFCEVECDTLEQVDQAAREGAAWCCSTIWTSRPPERRSRSPAGTARRPSPAAASLSRPRGPSLRPGSIIWRSGRSHTPRRRSTSASICA